MNKDDAIRRNEMSIEMQDAINRILLEYGLATVSSSITWDWTKNDVAPYSLTIQFREMELPQAGETEELA